MSRLLTVVNELRELLMGPLLVGVVILIIWSVVMRPALVLLPLAALAVFFLFVVNIGFV